jgi:HEPN domain-containing protein
MNEKVKYWLDLSDYDYDTALAMQLSGRYLYVGFMCHQTIEKILKAFFNVNNTDPAPYTHSLSYIAKKAGIYESLNEEFKDFIDVLEPLNIQARYPSHKEKLMLSLTKEKCEEILAKTKDL